MKWIISLLIGFKLILSMECGCVTHFEFEYQPSEIHCFNISNLDIDINIDLERSSYLYIENLKLNNNTLSKSFFPKFHRLNQIEVVSSNLQDILPGTFDGISYYLGIINLERNNLSSINPGVFNSLKELQDINLAYNRIKTVSDEAFIGTQLKSVNLTGNRISTMGDWPRYLRLLKNLDLSFNNLTEIGNLYPSLENLNFSGNSISKIGNNLLFLHDLMVLDVSYNNMEEIGNFYPNLSMQTLRLDHNKFKTLHLHSAKIVYASYNNLVEWNFTGIIGEFHLKQNHFQSLKGILPKAVKLFDVSENSITQIQDDFFSISDEMNKLNLSSNKLSSLPLQFSKNLSNLINLDLSKNEFTSFSFGLFDGLLNLQTLNISANRLIAIPPSLHSLKKLTNLYIQNNDLTKFDSNMLRMSLQLREVDINENSWNCKYLLHILHLEKNYNFVRGTYFNGSNIMGIKCIDENQSSSRVTQSEKSEVNVSWENFINNDFRKSTFYKFFNENFNNTNFVKFYTQTNTKVEDEVITKIEKLSNIMEQLNRNMEKLLLNEKIIHYADISDPTKNQIISDEQKLQLTQDNESPNGSAFVFIYIITILNIILTSSLAYVIYKKSKLDPLKGDVQMTELFDDIS